MKMCQEYALSEFLENIGAVNQKAMAAAKEQLLQVGVPGTRVTFKWYETPGLISYCGGGCDNVVCLTRRESETCWAGYVRGPWLNGWRGEFQVRQLEHTLLLTEEGGITVCVSYAAS